MSFDKHKIGENLMNKNDVVTIFTTVSTLIEAKKIAKECVAKKLAACANIIDNVTSIYKWQEELSVDNEVCINLKTTKSKSKELILYIKSLHTYECPCIVTIPLIDGNEDYIKWIHESLN